MSHPTIKASRLANGVNVVTEERAGTGKVSMQIYVKMGGVDEKAEESGLTNLMQAAAQTGTTTRSRDQIADEIEGKGSPIQSSTTMETTVFETSALTRNAADAFGVLADVIINPVFDPQELEQTKDEIAQAILQGQKNPSAAAGRKFWETAFAGQSLGANTAGTPELVASYTQAQVKQKHAELLSHPENIVISFAGDIKPEEAEKLAAQWFGQLTGAKKQPVPDATFTGGEYREGNNSNQVNINIGFKAPDADDPDRYAMQLFRAAFSGGMSSPLFQELRVKRGLVYTPMSDFAMFEKAGAFVISNGTGKGKAGELVTAVVDLLGKVAREGVTQEELDIARERILRGSRNARERASTSAGVNAAHILKQGRPVPFEEFEQKMNNVTTDDIRRVVGKMLKSGEFAISSVGPQDTMPTTQELKDLVAKQVLGVDLPAPSTAKPSIKATFAAKSQKTLTEQAPKVTTLKNGLKVFTIERPGPLSIGGWVGAGSDHETPELNGATHVNEHMMFRGTPSYPSGTIDKIVEGEMGGGLNAYTTNDKTVYYFYSMLPEHLEKSVDIIGEMIFKADIKQTELTGTPTTLPDGTVVPGKGEIEAVMEEYNMGNDSPGRIAYQTMMSQAYAGQTHGQTVIGTEPVLRAMTADMLRDYRDEYYSPDNVIFGAAGPIKHEDFVKFVEERFGDLDPTNFPPLPVPTYKGGTKAVEHSAAQMATVIMSAEGASSADPENYAMGALALIIGGGGSSRLNKEVVNHKRLALYAGAGTTEFRNAGTFDFQAMASPENVKPLMNAIYAELRRLPADVTEEELDKAKGMIELGIRKSYETNQSAADNHGVDLQASGQIVTMDEKIAAINALTLDDIRNAAKKVLASNPSVSMVVPPGTAPALLPDHNEVVKMRDGAWQQPKAANTNKPKPPANAA